MAQYKYRAVDKDGSSVEGTLEETSARRVVEHLQSTGMTVNAVEKVGAKATFPRMKSRLSWEDLAQFNEQILAYTRSGLPLASSMAALAHDLENPRLKSVFEDVRKSIEAGSSLQEGLSGHPRDFPPLYLAMVSAGERAGNLPGVFATLAAYSRSAIEMKSRAQQMLVYPLILVIAATCVVAFLMTYVIPMFSTVMEDFRGRLPWITRCVMDWSHFWQRHGWGVLGLVVALVILGFALARSYGQMWTSGYNVDYLKLKLGVMGKAYRAASLGRFCRALGMLLGSRVPMLESLTMAAAAAGNAVLARSVENAAKGVSGGSGLADALGHTGYFKSGFCWLLRHGEERGDVDSVLLSMADECDRDVDRLYRWTLTMAGPIVIVAIGLVVGFIVLSVYLPLFSASDAVGLSGG